MSKTLTHSSIGKNDVLLIDNAKAKASISLFGGHVLSFVPKSDGRDRLWVSDNANYDAMSSIRGGVPICWPWFADRHGQPEAGLPFHGYVRKQHWQLVECQELEDETQLVLAPTTSEDESFAKGLDLKLQVNIGDAMTLRLITNNTSDKAVSFTCALHTYFAVPDLAHTRLTGLTGSFEDKTQGFTLSPTPLDYSIAGETDRVHITDSTEAIITHAQGKTVIGSRGHDSVVVWNPARKVP